MKHGSRIPHVGAVLELTISKNNARRAGIPGGNAARVLLPSVPARRHPSSANIAGDIRLRVCRYCSWNIAEDSPRFAAQRVSASSYFRSSLGTAIIASTQPRKSRFPKPERPAPLRAASVSLKLRFDGDKALGPGKIRLLELIDATGSISAASRQMDMSYPRAWRLVDDLNTAFATPLVRTQIGGASRGGATLTKLGREVVRRYRAIEGRVYTTCARHLQAIRGVLAK